MFFQSFRKVFRPFKFVLPVVLSSQILNDADVASKKYQQLSYLDISIDGEKAG